jgi:hypothetical protein
LSGPVKATSWGVLLDRLACLAAIGLELDRRPVFERALWTFIKVYEQGFDDNGVPCCR